MMDFELDNKNGNMFVEPRTDGGIGIFVHVEPMTPSVCLPLTKDEILKLAGWLITYIESQKNE